jgi:hypothetical protein
MRWCVLKVNRFAALNTWRLSCDSINKWSRFLSSIAYGVRRRGTATSQSTAAASAAPLTKRDGNYWNVCCLGGEMGDSDGGLRRWSVRIAKMQQWMVIGMCQIRQAQSHKFEGWNWSNIGHGHYCVTSHGYVFSHSDASANCKNCHSNSEREMCCTLSTIRNRAN